MSAAPTIDTTAGDDLLYGRVSTGYRPGAPNRGCCRREQLKTVGKETPQQPNHKWATARVAPTAGIPIGVDP